MKTKLMVEVIREIQNLVKNGLSESEIVALLSNSPNEDDIDVLELIEDEGDYRKLLALIPMV